MHQPGYIQEGQEAIFGDLLLGIYHRRIPGDTVIYFLTQFLMKENIFFIRSLR
jgi:hypothetical protein